MGKRKATILLYHQIGKQPKETTNLDCFCNVEQFEEQMKFLIDSDIELISLKSLVKMMKDKELFKKDYVVLTFDDGCERFQTTAIPILKKYNIPATIYPVCGYLGTVASWPKINNPDLRLISEENLKGIALFGIDVGGHTVNHIKLSEVELRIAKSEIVGCKEHLERIIEKKLHSFSYPHGSYNNDIVQLVSKSGFECAVTCKADFIYGEEDLFQLPRKYVTYTDTIYSFKQIVGHD
jgi:peptidoglycan/xylan/chitin deacetylase (PgdA/CDA1 family)